MVGGLFLLIVIMLSLLITAIKNDRWSDSTRTITVISIVAVGLLMTVSNRIKTAILQIWLVMLVAIPALVVLGMIGWLFYQILSQPL